MSEAPELEAAHWDWAVRLGLAVRPVVLHTGWYVGPVIAFLFPDDPVTLLDCGYDNPEARAELEHALEASGLAVSDVRRIIVTHGHTDHYGCASWIKERSGCEVLMHRADAERFSESWGERTRRVMAPLGVPPEILDRYMARADTVPLPPQDMTLLDGGEVLRAGSTDLQIVHRPGHSPGHIVAIEATTKAAFVGDFVLGNSPTNAGLEPGPGPLGRLPMLAMYDEGLRELASLDAPVLFCSHGQPVSGHRELIERRLAKSKRRTDKVMRTLKEAGESTPVDLVMRQVGERIGRDPWGFISDLTGRLDMLVGEGRATFRMRQDGVQLFKAVF